MLVDSTVIDSTAAGQPAVFDLETAIPGLQEGIQMMNVGGVYRFFIPPELAYGENGVAPVIPPNAVLIFDVTLEGIAGEEAPPAS
jgi:peptidylprolyl isomerase